MKKALSLLLAIGGLAASQPASAATVAYWQFDNINNTSPASVAYADSVGTYNLSAVTGSPVSSAFGAVDPVPNPDTTAGFSGDPSANPDGGTLVRPSLLFNGNTRMEVSSDPGNVFNLSGKSFTFEGWFQHTSAGAIDGFGDIIGGTRNASPFGGYLMMMSADGTLKAFLAEDGSGGDSFNVATSGTDYRGDSEYHHFALLWQDGMGTNGTGLVQIYVDGLLEASGSAPAGFSAATADSNDNSFIMAGRNASSGNFWDGRFDEFRFSNEALSPSQFLNAVAVPEPHTLSIALLGLLGAASITFRRRR